MPTIPTTEGILATARRWFPLAVLGFAVAVLAVGLAFRDVQLSESPTLWAAVAALAVGGNGATAFLLWVRSRIAGSVGLAGIGSSYAYAAALGIPYFLAVPLAIAHPGPAAHLTYACWVMWHVGFPIGVIATVLAVRRAPEKIADDRIDRVLPFYKYWAVIFSALGIAGALVYARFTPDALVTNTILLVLNCTMALSFLAVRPIYRALGPWICAALATSALDVVARVFAEHPYSALWYSARLEMLLASAIVLAALFADIDRAYRRLSRLVTHDYLTGLLNRATFETRFEVALAYATRNKTPLAVIIVDVDHFKTYNDRYGHLQGDAALKSVAAAIGRAATRNSDVAGRLGGEEFGLVLSIADIDGAQLVADRILSSVAVANVVHEGTPSGVLSVSVGLGFAERLTMADKAILQEAADAALYDAKHAGRSQSAHRIVDHRGDARF